MNPRFLVSGAASGLGRALHERFGGTALTRTDDPRDLSPEDRFDIILHCAINTRDRPEGDGLYRFVNDNLLLTDRLLDLPHAVFVHVSSVDVYPKNDAEHTETEALSLDMPGTPYGTMKLASEALVRERAPEHVILRPTALLGRHMRPNSLVRLLTEEDCRLTLAPESRFNYVRHETVAEFVERVLDSDQRGIFNLASSGNMSLGDIAARYGRRPAFGSFRYDVGRIDNRKSVSLLPALARRTEDVLDEFVGELSA